MIYLSYFFFFKQKTAYEMRISDWSSDVCSSDLPALERAAFPGYALLLNDGRYALLRNAEAAQRIAGEAERQLARAHDREADALTFEMGDLGFAVGPDRGVDFGIELARDLDDAPCLKAIRRRDHEQPRLGDIRRDRK